MCSLTNRGGTCGKMTPITGGAVLAAGRELGDLQPAAGVCICVFV